MTTFIQIGAGAGDRDARAGYRDGFSELVKAQPVDQVDRIILVEPNPVNIPALRACWDQYTQAEIHQLGICPPGSTDRTITFYYAAEDGPHFQVFSMSPEHVRKHYPTSELLQEHVRCVTLEEFLEETVGDGFVDLISLDIEGIDAEILLTTDWSRVNCALLSFEVLHLDDQADAVARRMAESGFQFAGQGVDHNGFDHLYRRIVAPAVR